MSILYARKFHLLSIFLVLCAEVEAYHYSEYSKELLSRHISCHRKIYKAYRQYKSHKTLNIDKLCYLRYYLTHYFILSR